MDPAEAGIHRLAIPTPFAVGRVNCWLIEDDPLTLVDTGPELRQGARRARARRWRAHGRRIEDLERIVITHQHIDHEGLVDILARRSGAEVCALDLLAPLLQAFGESSDHDDELAERLMLRHGIPRDVVIALRALTHAFRALGLGRHRDRAARATAATLEFADRTLHVLHRPGHSPSDTVFHDRERGILIGGDHLIAHISSNALISRPIGGKSGEPGSGRPRSLLTYMRSLRETQAMDDVAVVLPGHGENITGHAALIEERFAMHEKRAAKLGGLLDDGPKSAYELAQAMWGNVAVTQAYLTLSEVLGHLDLLAERGALAESEVAGIVRYAHAA